MIEEALRTLLTQDPAIAALTDRIRGPEMQQDEQMPAVTITSINSLRAHSYLGVSGFAVSSFQVTSWADTHLGALQLAQKVRAKLDGFRGAVDQDVIDGILSTAERQFRETDPRKLWRVDVDFDVQHSES